MTLAYFFVVTWKQQRVRSRSFKAQPLPAATIWQQAEQRPCKKASSALTALVIQSNTKAEDYVASLYIHRKREECVPLRNTHWPTTFYCNALHSESPSHLFCTVLHEEYQEYLWIHSNWSVCPSVQKNFQSTEGCTSFETLVMTWSFSEVNQHSHNEIFRRYWIWDFGPHFVLSGPKSTPSHLKLTHYIKH